MKKCTDCKYCYNVYGDGNLEYIKCNSNKQATIKDYATGLTSFEYLFCSILRKDGFFWCRVLKTCGREGRFFEKKKESKR